MKTIRYKYNFSRKSLDKQLDNLMSHCVNGDMDLPTIWSHINQIRINLLSTLPQEEKKCEHKIKEFVGVNVASCKKCGCLFVPPFKDMPLPPSLPEFEEIKPAKKIVTYSGSERYPNLKELWEKQCEIIDTINKLIKQK